MDKKKVLFHSNFHRAFTGFGKNAKNVLRYLHNTGKYEIVELANGLPVDAKIQDVTPWKVINSLPPPEEIPDWTKSPDKERQMGYGAATIDRVIENEKPDIYIGAEDIWAFNGYWNKIWWNKITCAVWTTLDSLPLLPAAIEAAPKIKNYFTWASFAEKEFKRIGINHTSTLRGTLEPDDFYALEPSIKNNLRQRYNIPPIGKCFITGFVFRNQLRKSVPNLLEGFKKFKDQNPQSNAKLLLHTHWSEGWDIPRFIKDNGVNPADVLTTYFCKRCKEYEIKPFHGQNVDCRFCGAQKSQETANTGNGVSEEQLNEIYNLMDVYCHPFTSGGQEIPIQEAKLAELITLVTNYSCGEDCCTPESGGIPLDWSSYFEPGTQFIKATTSPESISKNLNLVYNMPLQERVRLGKISREWTIENFSTKSIGSKLEKFIDSAPKCDWDFDFSFEPRNPNYNPPQITSDSDWLIDIYKNILKMNVDTMDEGHKNWMASMAQGRTREQILKFFKDTASRENSSNKNPEKRTSLKDLIDDDKEKRLVVVMPRSIGDVYMTTSLLPSLAKNYPDYAIYFATNTINFPILDGNPYIYKCIPYHPQMDDLLFLEGKGEHEGFFDIAFLPNIGTQKIFNYQHNGMDKIQFDLCTS